MREQQLSADSRDRGFYALAGGAILYVIGEIWSGMRRYGHRTLGLYLLAAGFLAGIATDLVVSYGGGSASDPPARSAGFEKRGRPGLLGWLGLRRTLRNHAGAGPSQPHATNVEGRSMVKPVPDGYPTVTPYLIVDGAGAAIELYCLVLGATERMRNSRVR